MAATNDTNGTNDTKRMLRSLGELSRDVAPPRDLWPSIAAQIAEEKARGPGARAATGGRRFLPTRAQWVSLAAVVAAVAVGIWLGRSVLPLGKNVESGAGITASSGTNTGTDENNAAAGSLQPGSAQAIPAAAFVTDPRYLKQRKEMIAALETQLQTLPPQTQQKVAGSLKTIRASMKDIEAALGRDPANALLQELLVNTYQDEMRVFTAVNEASDAGGGI